MGASQAEVQGRALSFDSAGFGHQLELGCQVPHLHFCCCSPHLADKPFMKTSRDPHHSPGFCEGTPEALSDMYGWKPFSSMPQEEHLHLNQRGGQASWPTLMPALLPDDFPPSYQSLKAVCHHPHMARLS